MFKKIAIVAFLIALSSVLAVCHAQQSHTVSFSYDLDGNRILRQIVVGGGSKNLNEKNDKKQQPIIDSFKCFTVALFPNPTDGRFSVVLNCVKEDVVLYARIVASNGIVVCEEKIFDWKKDFDLTQQAAGIYFLQLSDGKEMHEWKIIKN